MSLNKEIIQDTLLSEERKVQDDVYDMQYLCKKVTT